jgi:hypothetical protein
LTPVVPLQIRGPWTPPAPLSELIPLPLAEIRRLLKALVWVPVHAIEDHPDLVTLAPTPPSPSPPLPLRKPHQPAINPAVVLAHDLPLLLLPMHPMSDQPTVARLVAEHGALA